MVDACAEDYEKLAKKVVNVKNVGITFRCPKDKGCHKTTG
jgi:hypothetical protein